MLTAAQAAVLNNKLALQLKSIGEMLCPPSTNNAESYAWDYWIADRMEKFCKGAKAAARKAAIKNGVMFDHEKEPLEPGSEKDVYSGDVIRISVSVKQPTISVDGRAFYDAIDKIIAEYGENMPRNFTIRVEEAFQGCMKSARPAHTFTATLLSE